MVVTVVVNYPILISAANPSVPNGVWKGNKHRFDILQYLITKIIDVHYS
jgi:hypothetical protein